MYFKIVKTISPASHAHPTGSRDLHEGRSTTVTCVSWGPLCSELCSVASLAQGPGMVKEVAMLTAFLSDTRYQCSSISNPMKKKDKLAKLKERLLKWREPVPFWGKTLYRNMHIYICIIYIYIYVYKPPPSLRDIKDSAFASQVASATPGDSRTSAAAARNGADRVRVPETPGEQGISLGILASNHMWANDSYY